MGVSSVVVGAADVEGVLPLEPEDDRYWSFTRNRVTTGQIVDQRMESIPRRHSQLVESSHRVELIQLALDHGPYRSRNASGGLAVDAVPDVPGRDVGDRPNHPRHPRSR